MEIKIGIIGNADDKKRTLLQMIKEFECSQNPSLIQFTELEFCSGLFGYMKQNGIREFNINMLESFIQLKLEEESMRFIFADIDKRTVIQEGISHFEIVGGIVRNIYSSTPKAKLTFSKDTAQKLVNGIPIQYSGYIQQFALEFPTFLENQMAKTKKLQKF